MTVPPPVLCERVSFAYEARRPVLRDVTLTIEAGETVALLGRNGAGKSTLLYLLMGLLQPGQGRVLAFGLDPVRHPVAVKQRIGFASELPMFPATLRAADLLSVYRRVYPTWDVRLERELVERFDLGRVVAANADMSKGQRQQLAILCAVCHRPELLILDEPASGLDPVSRRDFLATILQQMQGEGSSVLFSSHNLSDVERFGGRAVLLHDGRLALDANLDALREEHALVLVPSSLVNDALWDTVPGVLCRRMVQGSWRVVVRGSAGEVERMLQARLGSDVVQGMPLTLEELFVEYTSRDSHVQSTMGVERVA